MATVLFGSIVADLLIGFVGGFILCYVFVSIGLMM